MKIIHTGDWHIGKIVNEFSMLEDQKYILEQLMSVIEKEKPDALVVSGDIFDRSIPPVEAVELVDEVFNRVVLELKTPVLAVSGNHDSAERLSFASRILTKNGLHITGIYDGTVRCISLSDNTGPVNFYLLPYTDPRMVRHLHQDNSISTHDDAMKKILENISLSLDSEQRNIMITHGYITYLGEQAETCDSERPLSVGGADVVSSTYFNIFNYTALGHLHSPQRVGADNIRYSGSLMKYSLSEVSQKKGLYIVDVDSTGSTAANFVELTPKRDMRIIKGPLSELINPANYMDANQEDYVYAILTDKGELMDPISKLRAVYPNIMGLSKENVNARKNSKTAASEGYKVKSKLTLFNEFYCAMEGEAPGEEAAAVMERIIGEVEREGL